MKRILIAAALAVAAGHAAAADIGVSITIGDPGYYGRIDIGDYPQPQVIYRRPLVVERVWVERAPVYLRVPPGHAKDWHKHCRKYDACSEQVYFVQDHWYSSEYAPRYRQRRGDRHSDERRDDRKDDRRDDRRDDDRRGSGSDHRGDERGRPR